MAKKAKTKTRRKNWLSERNRQRVILEMNSDMIVRIDMLAERVSNETQLPASRSSVIRSAIRAYLQEAGVPEVIADAPAPVKAKTDDLFA